MAKLKRYLLFTFSSYYPCGGAEDFVGSFDTFEEAEENIKDDEANILDTETGKITYFMWVYGAYVKTDREEDDV